MMKKSAFWIIAISGVACIAVALCFLINPKNDEPDLSADTSKPMIITSNGETVTPYVNWLWAQNWSGDGWLAADGMSVIYTLSELADGLPVLLLADDFKLNLAKNVTFSYLSVYDENYERIYHNDSLDRLKTLPSGTYYVSIAVSLRGAYVAEPKGYEATGYECVFKLIKRESE